MNDLIRAKLKEIIELQNIIKKDDLNYKSKRGRLIILVNFTVYCFLRDVHEGHLSIERPDNKQSNFANELKNFNKGTKPLDKTSFSNNLGLLFSAREKVLNSFKSRLFSIRNLDKIATREAAAEPATEKALTKNKISKLKL